MGHWYTKEGETCYEATLRDARKHKLYPSVTTILSVIDGGSWLAEWKVNQTIIKAKEVFQEMTEAGRPFAEVFSKDTETLKKWIKQKLRTDRDNILELGTGVHRLCEAYLSNDKNIFELEKTKSNAFEVYLKSEVEEILKKYKKKEDGYAEEVVVSKLGYAGRVDYFWLDDIVHIRDFKTQNIKKGKPNFQTGWVSQLVAYGQAVYDKELFEPEKIDVGSIVISTNKETQGSWEKNWGADIKIQAWRIFVNAFNLWKTINKYDPLV